MPSLINPIRFLWATFLIDEICAGSCDDDIRRSLRQLPKDLEETFKRALLRIVSRSKHLKLVQRTFRWVAVARRPLTLDELREAVSIDVGQKHSRPERLPHNMNRISLWCENLLHFTEAEPARVQFAHASVRDFVTRATLSQQLFDFHVDLEETDHFVGQICVTYLHFSDFMSTIARKQQPVQLDPVRLAVTALASRDPSMARVSEAVTHFASRRRKKVADPDLSQVGATYGKTHAPDMATLQNSHPFLQYAATHWFTHTADFEKEQCSIWDLWLLLVSGCSSLAEMPWRENFPEQDEQGLLVWSHKTHHYALLYHELSGVRKYERKEVLHLMESSATQGDSKAIAIFLQAHSWPNYWLSRLLQKASEGGHTKVVDKLLNAGADANAAADDEYRGQTALQAASGGGHIEVVERLLGAEAVVNIAAAKFSGQTALQAASGGGHLQVVDRLLSAGADVNATAADFKGLTALQAASNSGHIKVVDRLLFAGADVNATTAEVDGLTALQAASGGGHLEVVERLLYAGADVDATAFDVEVLTPLQAASNGGYIRVVDCLLAAGADVNATAADLKGRTALQAASRGGHLEVVKRLLSAGADINATAAVVEGLTALQAASSGGHLGVVELLLNARADANAAASKYDGRTALQAASDGHHHEIAHRLLDAGAHEDLAAMIFEVSG